jgi:hypothetical protein
MRRTGVICALALTLLFALCVARAVRAETGADQTILINQRLPVTSSEARYTFTAPANNLYTFRSFGAEGASGILYRYGDASPSPRARASAFPRASSPERGTCWW